MNKIAVVNSRSFGMYFPDHLTRLDALGGVDILEIAVDLDTVALAKKLVAYQYLIVSVTPVFDACFFEHSPNLKLIARHGLGFNNIDLEAATKHGVYVTKVEGRVEREAVAEHTVALMMSLVRGIPQADHSLREKPWSERSNYVGREVAGATIGIIGYGNVGTRVGDILTQGFAANVLVYDPHQSSEYVANHFGTKVSLEKLLADATIISLNAAVASGANPLISYGEIKQMKKEVMIINTARGQLIDEKALVEGLTTGKISGYAADVYTVEPIAKENLLLSFANVILTPHIGAYTYPSLAGMGENVIKAVTAVCHQEIPSELVNKGVVAK